MKSILIVLATLFTFQLQASDVIVTAENAFPPTYTGSISVDINPQLGNAPFVITVYCLHKICTFVSGSWVPSHTFFNPNFTHKQPIC